MRTYPTADEAFHSITYRFLLHSYSLIFSAHMNWAVLDGLDVVGMYHVEEGALKLMFGSLRWGTFINHDTWLKALRVQLLSNR